MAEATLAISVAPLGRGIETDTLDLDRLEQDNIATAPTGEGCRARTLVLCGPPLPGHEVQIRGEDGSLRGEREVGRILARGPSLMRGYDGIASQTEAVLSPEGWLETGDLGYWREGALVITGRAKDLIIINGRNVWPQDLEWTIEQAVPGIRTGDVAAFSVEENGQEILILAAEARAGGEGRLAGTLEAAICDTVRAQHGLDGRVILVAANSLPYTSSGKLSRSAARRRYLAGTLAPAALPA
jgi:fatty-acyl-CoA synthase